MSDDMNFTGPGDGEQVTIAVQTFSTHVARIGLRFQGHKSKIINFLAPATIAFAAANEMAIVTDACVIVGVPMGPDRARVQALALSTAQESQRFFDAISHTSMPPDAAERLLRLCGVLRLNYLSRVGVPGAYSQALEFFDNKITESSGRILRSPNNDPAPTIDLPIRRAGLALRPYATQVGPIAYLSCVANASSDLLRCFPDGLPPIFAFSITATLALILPTIPVTVADEHLPPPDSQARECLEFYQGEVTPV
jgi:hypothetical protein